MVTYRTRFRIIIKGISFPLIHRELEVIEKNGKKRKFRALLIMPFFTQEREMDRYFETEQELGTNQKLFEVTDAHDDVIVLNVLRRK